MLSLEPCSPRESWPVIVVASSSVLVLGASYFRLRAFAGSYSSSCFHIARAIAAIKAVTKLTASFRTSLKSTEPSAGCSM